MKQYVEMEHAMRAACAALCYPDELCKGKFCNKVTSAFNRIPESFVLSVTDETGPLIDRTALLEHSWDADTRCGYVQVVDVGDILEAPVIIKTHKEESEENG